MIIIMKRNEIIELNGVEYTLELNRDSFLKIDQYSNIQKSMNTVRKDLYEHIDEIDDDTDPFAETISDEQIEQAMNEKIETLQKLLERAYWIWLYPNHKLSISQVKEILKPYYENDKKFEWISEKYGQYMQACVEIKNEHLEQLKNLKAQANKK